MHIEVQVHPIDPTVLVRDERKPVALLARQVSVEVKPFHRLRRREQRRAREACHVIDRLRLRQGVVGVRKLHQPLQECWLEHRYRRQGQSKVREIARQRGRSLPIGHCRGGTVAAALSRRHCGAAKTAA